jgi:release factor family 10
MELALLQRHIRELATLPETDAPVVSCYIELSQGSIKDGNAYVQQVRALERGVIGPSRQHVSDAIRRIDKYLELELLPDAKGLAAFSRAGEQPYFLTLQFRVAVPNWISADSTPNIFHAVELKDTYHRYVVMICSENSARILEVNLGSVTAQLWKQRPDLRKRVGREWTKKHYQNHRRDRLLKFVKEKVKILEKLMSAGGHTHLILAGHPSITNRVRSELPKRLQAKLVDTIPASAATPVDDVVKSTIMSFVVAEENESREAAEELVRQLRTGGLAVAGTESTHRALYRGQADVVVIGKEYEPGIGWACGGCGHTDVYRAKPAACPECDAQALREFDIKGAIVRMAEQQGCTIEVVNESEVLRQLGCIGCLLRYRQPEDYH